MPNEAHALSRREMLAALAFMSGTASGLGGRAMASVTEGDAHARDWAWLVGNWDVWHRRLKERLAGSSEWDEFPGRCNVWLTMGGLGTIDDCSLNLPGGVYRAIAIRAFDPGTDRWSIWWLDVRNPTRIDPPVMGGFAGDNGTFQGPDTFNGRPITVRFRWFETGGSRPHWEQAFSADGGATWEVNHVNFFTRTAAVPSSLPAVADAPGDFAFLAGSWSVRHRRLRQRLAGGTDWENFAGTLINRPVMGGQGNVGDNLFDRAGGPHRGVGLRAYDPASRQWLSWWLDGRNPATIAPPVRGGFSDGVGTFLSDDTHEGRPVKTRVLWSRITPRSARWEQAFSADGGATWEVNWVSDFTRAS